MSKINVINKKLWLSTVSKLIYPTMLYILTNSHSMHDSPCTARSGADTGLNAGIDSGVGARTCAGCGRALSYSLAADPLGLVNQRSGMGQSAYVPHPHQQVAPHFQDVNGLIMGDGDEALPIHL